MSAFAKTNRDFGPCGQRIPARSVSARKADLIDLDQERSKRRPSSAFSASPALGPAVRIYRPARSVMQAGRARTKKWVLEFEPRYATEIEPLMGWTSSRDTLQQVKLTFPSKERAVAFAERQGWPYTVIEPHEPKIRPKSYADNFRWQHPPATPTGEKGQARGR
ncbi:ETC complex I subunit [Oceanibaculum pacificum]|jgi:hypothetical protein|nr:ETC complex I subunit [Oceanibaculum pacificum]